MPHEGVKTYITNGANILFQILALTGVIDVDSETQLAITGGLIAIAGIFQRLGTKKAEAAALRAATHPVSKSVPQPSGRTLP